ncbi:MAG: DegV family protein [Oscillospiraceae bacterium]
MSTTYILSCESTVDLPYAYVEGRGIPVLFYTYSVDGQEYPDDMGRDPQALPRFYEFLEAGKMPSTSQLNVYKYQEFFEELLQKGDVLHIAFGSGMTPSVRNAVTAAELLREKYPERRLIVIDSLCSSSGYGLLVDEAADMRDRGCSMEEVEAWVLENRQKIHHQFFSTDLKYYRRSGRVSGAAAAIGAVLNICPVMRLDDGGRIIAYDKVRGKKRAIETTLQAMEAHAQGGTQYAGKCWICHSNCLAEAEQTRDAVRARFPRIQGDIRICDIGTIIASHCGPGTVAVFFIGDDRAPYPSPNGDSATSA